MFVFKYVSVQMKKIKRYINKTDFILEAASFCKEEVISTDKYNPIIESMSAYNRHRKAHRTENPKQP